MRAVGIAVVISIAPAVPQLAHAAPREVIHPVQLGQESVRFDHGVFTVEQAGQRGAVQIAPETSDHGNLSFKVAVFNAGDQPVNIDVSSIRIEGTAQPVRLLTHQEMVQKAENRAGWATALTAIGGALVSASQASQRNYYSASSYGRYGSYHTVISAPCYSCQVAAAATAADTAYSLDRIQAGLDAARQTLGDQMLQMTTLDPGRTYGGRIFLTRFKRKPMSEMRLIVRFNDEDYVFGFRFAKAGTPPPAFRMIAPVALPAPAAMPVTLAATAPMSAPAVAPARPVASPPAFAPTRYAALTPPPVPAQVAPRAPAPATRPAAPSAAWQRYYRALRESGVADAKARAMANAEFGAQ